jgi:hydrogenase expression/formation protein HypC
MCLAIPSKIISIEDSRAVIDVYGARRDISLMLLEGQVKVGDYVIVHAGFAIQKLDADIAKETIGYFNEYLGAIAAEEGKALPSTVKSTKRVKTKR